MIENNAYVLTCTGIVEFILEASTTVVDSAYCICVVTEFRFLSLFVIGIIWGSRRKYTYFKSLYLCPYFFSLDRWIELLLVSPDEVSGGSYEDDYLQRSYLETKRNKACASLCKSSLQHPGWKQVFLPEATQLLPVGESLRVVPQIDVQVERMIFRKLRP